MPNKFRVDRHDSHTSVPVGMNSIVYIGDNVTEAVNTYTKTQPGLDTWNHPDPNYGVLMAQWNEAKQDYEVQLFKRSAA